MNTPWGTSDSITKLTHGVSWVSTPSHGGLAVSQHVAETSLSGAARHIGEFRSGYFFFEEDCAYAVAFFEHPEWALASDYLTFRTEDGIRNEMESVIRRWFPSYFSSPDHFIRLSNTALERLAFEGASRVADETQRFVYVTRYRQSPDADYSYAHRFGTEPIEKVSDFEVIGGVGTSKARTA